MEVTRNDVTPKTPDIIVRFPITMVLNPPVDTDASNYVVPVVLTTASYFCLQVTKPTNQPVTVPRTRGSFFSESQAYFLIQS